jgi:transcriptional regulator with XRE-family HTH domain
MTTAQMRKRMAAKKISNKRLAEEAQTSESMVSMILNDRYIPSGAQKVKLENALERIEKE